MKSNHTNEKNISVWTMRGSSNTTMYYLHNTMGAEPDEEAQANASIFTNAINIANNTGHLPQEILTLYQEYKSGYEAQTDKLTELSGCLKDAMDLCRIIAKSKNLSKQLPIGAALGMYFEGIARKQGLGEFKFNDK